MLHARSKSSGKSRLKQSLPLVSWSEANKRTNRARSETDMIAAALAGAPPLDRTAMGAEPFPFNGIASSNAVIALVEKLARQRTPENPWHAAHRALLRTDQNGKGYAEFTDVVRDVCFQVGVDYALRSLPGLMPDWWDEYQALDLRSRKAVETLVRFAASARRNGGDR